MYRRIMTATLVCLLVSPAAMAANLSDCRARLAFVDARQAEYRLGWTMHDSLSYVRGMTLESEWDEAAWWTRHVHKFGFLPRMRDSVWRECQEAARTESQRTLVRDPTRY